MTTTYVPIPGSLPLSLAHLKAFGFTLLDGTDAYEWGTPEKYIMVRPSGHMTWYVITDACKFREVQTVGQLRTCVATYGIEPWF